MTCALLIDLNNFARYPTLAIGYLVAALRGGGCAVEVLSPLSKGVPAVEREGRERLRDQAQRRVYFSTHAAVSPMHDVLRSCRSWWLTRPHPRVLRETRQALDRRQVDVLLLSAYVDHYPSVVALCELAASRGVPVLLGGPVFNIREIAREWLPIPGLTAIVGGEVDLTLPDLVRTAVEDGDLTRHAGVVLPDGRESGPAPPLHDLSRLPVPDFRDFPWERYPMRVIPAMAGRGCSWGRCTFCGDVFTANGRTFRSRPVENVLDELEEQSARYGTKDFIFLDIKLNSDLRTWRGLIDRFQDRLPQGRWIGTVHVDANDENGLSRDELRAAHEAGLTRTTFGLETGSQWLNNAMAKGTSLERTSQFIRDAHRAGISVRTTAMVGYPGETPDDLRASADFLAAHGPYLDRVRLSRFKALPGSRFQQMYDRNPGRFPGITRFAWDYRRARARYRYGPARDRAYRTQKARLLNLVHAINRKPLRAGAEVFDGLM